MNEENKIAEMNPEIEEPTMNNDELKTAIEETMEQIRTQSMLLGAQAMCSVVQQKIAVAMSKPGKRSLNDYKRLVKEIMEFCEVGLSRKVNLDGTTSPINDNTKLMEEADESNVD